MSSRCDGALNYGVIFTSPVAKLKFLTLSSFLTAYDQFVDLYLAFMSTVNLTSVLRRKFGTDILTKNLGRTRKKKNRYVSDIVSD